MKFSSSFLVAVCAVVSICPVAIGEGTEPSSASPNTVVSIDALPSLASVSGDLASDYLALAAELAKFEDNGTTALGKEAKKRECLALLTAIQLGESSVSQRCADLVEAIRADHSYSSQDRFSVSAAFQHLKLLAREGSYTDKESKFQDLESVERSLLAEYPDVGSGYEALLHVGESTPSQTQAAQIGSDLSKMLRSPQWVRMRAEALSERIKLVGRPISEILSNYAEKFPELAIEKNVQVLVYSWSASNETSITLAKKYADLAPKGAVVIGVCLDEALGATSAPPLPGIQILDPLGSSGPIARALMLTHSPLAYVTDEAGVIANVMYAGELQQM